MKFWTIALGVVLLSYGCTQNDASKKGSKSSSSLDAGVLEPGHRPAKPPGTLDPLRGSEGDYVAEWTPLNGSQVPDLKGAMALTLRGDQITVEVKLTGLEAYSVHAQYIYTQDDCPGIEMDVNNDGFLDRTEIEASVGKVLIPLDGDLSAQMLDQNVFPTANAAGKYFYTNSTSLALMISDLVDEDLEPGDLYAKLAVGEALNLESRALVIFGAPQSAVLPSTVRSFSGLNRQASLPIACAQISRAAPEDF